MRGILCRSSTCIPCNEFKTLNREHLEKINNIDEVKELVKELEKKNEILMEAAIIVAHHPESVNDSAAYMKATIQTALEEIEDIE